MWLPTCPRWVHVGCRPSPGHRRSALVYRKGPGHTPAPHHWSEIKHDTKWDYLTQNTGQIQGSTPWRSTVHLIGELWSTFPWTPSIYYCLNSFSATKHKLWEQCSIMYSLPSNRQLSVVVNTNHRLSNCIPYEPRQHNWYHVTAGELVQSSRCCGNDVAISTLTVFKPFFESLDPPKSTNCHCWITKCLSSHYMRLN